MAALQAKAPQLQTGRLLLEPYTAADFGDVMRILTDPRVIWWRKEPYSEAQVWDAFERTIEEQRLGFGWWLVRDRNRTLLGQTAIKPLPTKAEAIELAYHFLVEARGRGYATEASHTLLGYGFDRLELPEIVAIVLPENEKSQAVIRRLRMPKVGTHDHSGYLHDLFAVTRTQWNELR